MGQGLGLILLLGVKGLVLHLLGLWGSNNKTISVVKLEV